MLPLALALCLGVKGKSLSAVLCRPLRQTQSAFNPHTAAAEIAAPAVYSGVAVGAVNFDLTLVEF